MLTPAAKGHTSMKTLILSLESRRYLQRLVRWFVFGCLLPGACLRSYERNHFMVCWNIAC